jgi:hypothetical protein
LGERLNFDLAKHQRKRSILYIYIYIPKATTQANVYAAKKAKISNRLLLSLLPMFLIDH